MRRGLVMRRGLMAWIASLAVAATAWAGDLSFSAQVDKTTASVGDSVKLTLTLSGDITGVKLPVFQFPEGIVIAARSQSSHFAIRSGAAERSVSLVYVLVVEQPGSIQLGPFSVEHQGQSIPTEPIEITVEKPPIPPDLPSSGQRFTL